MVLTLVPNADTSLIQTERCPVESKTYSDEEFRRDIVELRELRERLNHIPRKFKQYDILQSKYRNLLKAASGKYHMDAEDIVLNFYNV